MKEKPHVFYDFDGTLGDSLPGHALFILDTNQRLSTGLNLPDADDINEWKKRIGMPMEVFIRNSGFPEELIPEILADYEKNFGVNSRYSSRLFPDIPKTIRTLFKKEFQQSVLSSNFKSNIVPALQSGQINDFFTFILARESLAKYFSSSKAECLKEYNKLLKDVIYVGDAESDWEAAQNAGVVFIGTSYGWQIRPGDKRFPIAHSPAQLERIILSLGE